MLEHTIRLAGPWERTVADETSRQQLPCELSPGTTLSRAFHQPTGLDPGHRVRIQLELALSDVEIHLNNRSVEPIATESNGSQCTATLDVTEDLQDFNRLSLLCRAANNVLHSVSLEIHTN